MEDDRKDESIVRTVLEAVWDTIEELTNKIASIFWSDDDDLHDSENWF